MHSISSYPGPLADYGNGSMTNTGSRYIKQESVTASRNQSMDLSLKTREGDVVTINTSSFSALDSYSYNQTGRMTNAGTSSTSKMSYRTMTLETGSSFTFSVKGDLNDGELDDIEKLVASLDKVMGSMVLGDMDGAVETALGITDYDTVSSFSADLNTQSSYTMATEIARERYSSNLDSDSSLSSPSPPSLTSLSPGLTLVEELVQRMSELMDEAEQDIQKKFQQPTFQQAIDQLFAEHLKAADPSINKAAHMSIPGSLEQNLEPSSDEKMSSNYQMVTELRDRMQALFDGSFI